MSLPKLFFHSFKTWASLKSHLSKSHSREKSRNLQKASPSSATVAVPVQSLHKENFLNTLIWKRISVIGVSLNCNFSTNISETPAFHRSLITTKCYYERSVQVLQIQIIKVRWMFRIVNHLSLMTVKVMMISPQKNGFVVSKPGDHF